MMTLILTMAAKKMPGTAHDEEEEEGDDDEETESDVDGDGEGNDDDDEQLSFWHLMPKGE